MLDRSWMRGIALAAAAGGVALALAAAPFAPGGEFPGFAPNAAPAKSAGDNGADHSGGRGGGNGHGKGKGGDDTTTLASPEGDSHGKGHTGRGNGHSKDAVSGVLSSHNGSHPQNHGALASTLGGLNAAHAIANGNTNDNLSSKVGQINAYMEAFNSGDIVGAADALIAASNKGLSSMEIDDIESVVSGVNDMIVDNGVVTTSDEEGITSEEAAVAAEIKSRE